MLMRREEFFFSPGSRGAFLKGRSFPIYFLFSQIVWTDVNYEKSLIV